MGLKFNPHTGEWEDVADRPSDPVAKLGTYFKGYWSSNLPDTATWLVFVGAFIVFGLALSLSGIVFGLCILGLFFEKTRNWLMLAGWLAAFSIAYAMTWLCYNKWTLICFGVFILGLLL